jgi:small subunit ribosomal protein S2
VSTSTPKGSHRRQGSRKLKNPIVALVDTNCDPDEVDFVIPGNDDAIRSCALIVRVMADAVAEGRQMLTEAQMKAEAERKAAEEAAIAEAVAAAEAAAAEAAEAEQASAESAKAVAAPDDPAAAAEAAKKPAAKKAEPQGTPQPPRLPRRRRPSDAADIDA